MGLAGKFIAVFTVLIAFTLYSKIKPMMNYPERPDIEDIWWGSGDPSKVDTSIKPFKINIPDDVSF